MNYEYNGIDKEDIRLTLLMINERKRLSSLTTAQGELSFESIARNAGRYVNTVRKAYQKFSSGKPYNAQSWDIDPVPIFKRRKKAVDDIANLTLPKIAETMNLNINVVRYISFRYGDV